MVTRCFGISDATHHIIYESCSISGNKHKNNMEKQFDMKKKVKLIFRFLVFCAGLYLILCSVTQVLMLKNSEQKMKRFFDEQANFDVLFTGISHMQFGVSPMELWNEYGIASFNLAQSFEKLPQAYWVLQMALEYTNPSLVVIDVRRIDDTDKSTEAGVSAVFDYFPLTLTKFRAVTELFSNLYEQLGYLFPIIKYHGRWEELTAGDFVVTDYRLDNGASNYMGGGIAVYESEIHGTVPVDDMLPGSELCTSYLRKMIELCQSKDIEVMLAEIPFPANRDEQRYANGVQVIANEYGISYLNFHQIPGVVSLSVDMANKGHVNDAGARKVSYYLGNFLKEQYQLPDRRDDPAYACWVEQYKTFRSEKAERIRGRRSLKKILMLLTDRHINTYIRIRPDSKLYEKPVLRKLVWNLCARKETLHQFVNAAADHKEYSAFICNETDTIIEQTGPEPIESEADGTYRFFNKQENKEEFFSSYYGVEIQAFHGETGEEIIHRVF